MARAPALEVRALPATDSIVQGNFIGTDVSGNESISNGLSEGFSEGILSYAAAQPLRWRFHLRPGVTLVNIALGNAQSSACPNGISGGVEVDIALLIQAVNNAVNGCGVG